MLLGFHSPYTEDDNGGQHVEIIDIMSIITQHPDYNGDTLDNDLALLRLNGTSSITPVKLDYTGIFNYLFNRLVFKD